jgi:hypothetical protein
VEEGRGRTGRQPLMAAGGGELRPANSSTGLISAATFGATCVQRLRQGVVTDQPVFRRVLSVPAGSPAAFSRQIRGCRGAGFRPTRAS